MSGSSSATGGPRRTGRSRLSEGAARRFPALPLRLLRACLRSRASRTSSQGGVARPFAALRGSDRFALRVLALVICPIVAAAEAARADDFWRVAFSDKEHGGNEIRAVGVACDKEGKPLVAVLQRDKSGEEVVSWRSTEIEAKALPALRGKLALGGDERLECLRLGSGLPAVAAFLRGKEKKIEIAPRGADAFFWAPPGDNKDHALERECLASLAGPRGIVFAWTQEGKRGESNLAIGIKGEGVESFSLADQRCCPCCRPALAARPDGTTLVAYREEMEGDSRDIYLRAAPPGTLDFGEAVRVSQEGFKARTCPMAGPALAALDDHAVLVAYVVPGNPPELKVARSIDGGKTFAAPVPVGSGRRPALLPLADGALALVYDGAPDGVFLALSKDGGASFKKAMRLDSAAKGVTAGGSAAATTADGKALFVAWIEGEKARRAAVLRRAPID